MRIGKSATKDVAYTIHIRPDTNYNLEVHRSALNLILIMRSNYTF